MYEKLSEKFQSELHKTANTLTLEITALGTRTDLLETKYVELTLAHSDLRRDFEFLTENYTFMQSQVEDLDNRRNNLRLRGIPETVTDLVTATTNLFHALLPDTPTKAFVCDRLHLALRSKPPVDNPPSSLWGDTLHERLPD